MSEFHDPELRQQLGRLSGPYPDDNEALAAWQRRVGQARRRRAVAWTTGAALSLVMATVGAAALQSPARHSVVPQKSSESSDDVNSSIATTEADEPSTVETLPDTSAPTSAVDTTPSTEIVDTSAPEAEGNEGPGSQGGTKNHGTPTTPSAGAQTQTFHSVGGSITVTIAGDELVITAVNPAAGFKQHESDTSGRKVGVTFSSSTHRSEITVRLSNGAMKQDINESDAHEESVPNDTAEGDSSEGHGD